jgi:hypothetical protein
MGLTRVVIEPESFAFTHRKFSGVVDVDKDGRLTARPSYRSTILTAGSLRELRDDIDALDAEAEAKTARGRALKEAAENPLPAVLAGKDSLNTIGVRGIDKRSGAALITWPIDGSKDKAARRHVLRPLTDAERAEFKAAQAADSAARAVPTPLSRFTLERELDLGELVGHYDRDRDLVAVEYEGVEYTANAGSPAAAIQRAICSAVIGREYPWTIESDRPILTEFAEDERPSTLFRTPEDAEAFLAAERKRKQANQALRDLTERFAFDWSIFVAEEVD